MAETPHSASFEQVRLGDTDMVVSSVGFGTYHLRDKIGSSEAIDAMGAAFEAGINLFDTSDNYGTEELIGLAVREGVLPRDEVVIATKTGLATSAQEHLAWTAEGKHVDITPSRISQQVEKSLRLLGGDVGVIDLYQLHSYDPSVHPDVPPRAMAKLIEEGKIRAYGVSNYPAQGIADLLHACDMEGFPYPATSQPFTNLVHGWDTVAAEITQPDDITTLAHSPLHKGLVTDNMLTDLEARFAEIKDEEKEESLIVIEEGLGLLRELQDRALDVGLNGLTELAIGWVAMHPKTVVLSSPTEDWRLQEVKAGAAWKPDEETLALVAKVQKRFAETNFSNITLELMKRMKIYYR